MVLASLFSRRKAQDNTNFVIVVDAGSFAVYDGGQALPPATQLEILQNLAKIGREEEWKIEAVFIGEPLRQVQEDGDFLGVQVSFSAEQAQRPQLVLDRAAKAVKSGGALVVTNDPNLEERAEDLGATVLRATSFKKGYEELFAVHRRPQSRLMKRRSQITQNHLRNQQEQGDDDGINDLIDLVD